ncbi:MAG: ABC transporter permease [Candidatus Buchananbacteria bacterium]|nr:ABC transporter permease [Candidatus Buchananbacteria bacterium]
MSTLLLSLHRSFVFALQSFWRNIWLSLVTIFIIFLTFMSVNFLVVINAISASAVAAVKDRIDVSIYFKDGVTEAAITDVRSDLVTLPEVKAIVYRSSDQNLEEFKSRHEGDEKIEETLRELEGNPLGATLIVKARDLNDYPAILKSLDKPEYDDLIEEKSYDDHQVVIDRINAITQNVRSGGIIISLVFVLIAALIVFNTVRIAIFTHQNEITIMKLVGASNWFVRAPFVFESLLYGLVACVIALVIIYPALALIEPELSRFFSTDFDIVGYFNRNLFLIFGGQLLGIIVLNLVSSSIALHKYLKA